MSSQKKRIVDEQIFKVSEYIVYPAHGVGQIIAIEEQEIAGYKLELFVLHFEKDKMHVKVPITKAKSVGMRKLVEPEAIEEALAILRGRAKVKRAMWARRAQEYEAKINSGDLLQIATVVRDLFRAEAQPEQSYSERQIYELAFERLVKEVCAVKGVLEKTAQLLVESHLNGAISKQRQRQRANDISLGNEIGIAAS